MMNDKHLQQSGDAGDQVQAAIDDEYPGHQAVDQEGGREEEAHVDGLDDEPQNATEALEEYEEHKFGDPAQQGGVK